MKSNFTNTQNLYSSQYSQLSQSNNYNSQSNEYGEYFNSQANTLSQDNNAGISGEVYGNDIQIEISKSKLIPSTINNSNVNFQDLATNQIKSVSKNNTVTQQLSYTQDKSNYCSKKNHTEVDEFYINYFNNMSNLKTKLILSYDKLEEETINIIKFHKSQLVSKLSLVDKIIDLEVQKIKDNNENVLVVNEKINFLFKQLLEVIKTINS